MRTPRLSRRLRLEAPIHAPDGSGGFTKGWFELGALWAEVAPAGPRLAAQPGAIETKLPLKVTVRAAPYGSPSRPEPGQRFRDGARVFPIASVADDAAGRFLLCLAHEEAAL
ncbi:head-tail adaptor, putative [Rubellimicrobium mesophilum DSM 19309]|uniref:Head-tail adaptor, putative n=1 Tax=Rubellimicrobium mesophilum DSM 19309 TaxID=442562 RepID=A0A017HRL0_9RHOB|nr:head-tail adaptor protein [Rubellimicrobium mesophilum]EYD77117.1 head-tail adaptor, putative [Rubellimicrobium mesophilum DSM 19309]